MYAWISASANSRNLMSDVSTVDSIFPVFEFITASEVTNWNSLPDSSLRNCAASSRLRGFSKILPSFAATASPETTTASGCSFATFRAFSSASLRVNSAGSSSRIDFSSTRLGHTSYFKPSMSNARLRNGDSDARTTLILYLADLTDQHSMGQNGTANAAGSNENCPERRPPWGYGSAPGRKCQ